MPDTSFEYTRSWERVEDFPHLGFSRNWENPSDYPTYEPDESVVRADMQSLHDETRDYINNELIPAVVESNSTEAARSVAEQARKDAEDNRTSSEHDRVSAETARTEAEQARVQAEEDRAYAELTRGTNESARAEAEKARVDAENARVDAENARMEAVKKYPVVRNGTWWVWDVEKGMYLDTGSPAQGDAFEYEDFTEEQLLELQEGCNDYIANELARREQLSPEFANSIAECVDITKLYVLPNGYIYAYMYFKAGGYTNQIPISVETTGEVFDGKGYRECSYVSGTTGKVSAFSDSVSPTKPLFSTGLIPVANGDVIRFKNCYMIARYDIDVNVYGKNGFGAQIGRYRADMSFQGATAWEVLANDTRLLCTPDENDIVTEITISDTTSVRYLRFTLATDGDPADAIITVNEEIIGVQTFTNQIANAVDESGNPYNNGKGWKPGYRLNSNGEETELAGSAVTGFIPVKFGDVVRFKNFPYVPNENVESSVNYIAIYNANFEPIASASEKFFLAGDYYYRPFTVDADTGCLTLVTLADEYGDPGYAYLRISATGLDRTAVVTVNEEIIEIEGYSWRSTGHAFVPADYEDRIIAAEKDIDRLEKAFAGDMAVYGIVDGENNIIMTGTLASGTYSLKYVAEDGTTTDICKFTMG